MIESACASLQTSKPLRGHHGFRAAARACQLTLASLLMLGLVNCGGEGSTPAPLPPSGPPAKLTALTLSGGRLNPAFDPSVTNYSTMFIGTNSLTLTPTAPDHTIKINGTPVASGSPSSPITLPVGTSNIAIVVTSTTGQTQTYTIAAHQLAQEAYMKASNTGKGDEFGTSVAIDGNTLVVGAPFEDGNGTSGHNNSGAVYVFTRGSSSWAQQAYIKASNIGANDQFGFSVALKGDTLVVGAPFEDGDGTDPSNDNALDSGAVYVFTRGSGDWPQQKYLKASNTSAEDQFGYSVALSNDTLAVGALVEDSGAETSGAVYVFTRSNGSWEQQGFLKASNTDANDWFGISVALDGETLAVGASKEDGNGSSEGNNSAEDSGAAYIFTRSGNVWTQRAYIKASNTDAGDEFGRRVALSGDTLAVGAYREDGNGLVDSGAVYVFTRSGNTWPQQAYLKASNASAHNRFGYAMALQGDTLVAGSSGEDSAGTGVGDNQFKKPEAWASGAAYVFTRSGTTWTQQAYVKASNTEGALTEKDSNGDELFGDQFGVIVAIDGDTVVVGASGEDGNGIGVNQGDQGNNTSSNSGAVYVLR